MRDLFQSFKELLLSLIILAIPVAAQTGLGSRPGRRAGQLRGCRAERAGNLDRSHKRHHS